jgi:hypothetical protein
MERTIERMIFDAVLACILVVGVYFVWVLRGYPESFKSEFISANGKEKGADLFS